MNSANIKLEKINHLILKHLNLILRTKFHDNLKLNTISFHEVKINKNRSNAIIYYNFLLDYKNSAILKNKIAKELEKKNKTLRFLLAQKLTIFKTPKLKFIYDDSIAKGLKIEQIISKINETKK